MVKTSGTATDRAQPESSRPGSVPPRRIASNQAESPTSSAAPRSGRRHRGIEDPKPNLSPPSSLAARRRHRRLVRPAEQQVDVRSRQRNHSGSRIEGAHDVRQVAAPFHVEEIRQDTQGKTSREEGQGHLAALGGFNPSSAETLTILTAGGRPAPPWPAPGQEPEALRECEQWAAALAVLERGEQTATFAGHRVDRRGNLAVELALRRGFGRVVGGRGELRVRNCELEDRAPRLRVLHRQ